MRSSAWSVCSGDGILVKTFLNTKSLINIHINSFIEFSLKTYNSSQKNINNPSSGFDYYIILGGAMYAIVCVFKKISLMPAQNSSHK